MAASGLRGQLWQANDAPVVTALGLASSLGHRASNAVAAYRCRMVRTTPSTYKVMDAALGIEVPLLVHQVAGVTDGYEQLGRWMRLAGAAIRDLTTTDEPVNGGRLGVIAILPDLGDDRLPDFESGDEPLPDLIAQALPPQWEPAAIHVEYGALGFARALAVAGVNLGSVWDRALIVAADSFVDDRSLTWLGPTGRLKSDDNPVGLVPGEAGACLILESPSSAERRGARPRGRVRGALVSVSDQPTDNTDDQAGRNMAACIRTAVDGLGMSGRPATTMFTDLNGETPRAFRLGTALTGLADCVSDPVIEHPAECFGEIGAALGAVATCLAVGSFDRRYAQSVPALIATTTDAGDAACVVLEQP